MELFLSESHDPHTNLAIEETLLREGGEAVFLWVNDPCVVIGRNQNPYRETNPSLLDEGGVLLVRRLSGGGAVYHDRGNLNYSLVSDGPCTQQAIDLALGILRDLGISASFNGRNDVTVNGAKVGGLAQCQDGRSLCHGTLMANVDLDAMQRALRPSPLKLSAHGIQSVKSRVANLRSFRPDSSVSLLIDTFENALGKRAKPAPVDGRIESAAKRLKSPEWVFGQSPAFELSTELRLPDGVYQFDFNVRGERIEALEIHTDSCNPRDIEGAAKRLVGQTYRHGTFSALAASALERR